MGIHAALKRRSSASTLGSDHRRLLWRSVQLPVNVGVAHDGLHILACLSKGNRFYKFLYVPVFSRCLPVSHAIIAGIVGGQRVFETAELIDHRAEILGSQLQVN